MRLPSAERICRGVAARRPSREPNASIANGKSARRSAASTPAGKSARQGAASRRRAGRGVWWGDARAASALAARVGRGASSLILGALETPSRSGRSSSARAQHPEDDEAVVAAPASRVAAVRRRARRCITAASRPTPQRLGPGAPRACTPCGCSRRSPGAGAPACTTAGDQLPDEAAEPRRAGRAVLVLQVPRPGAAVVLPSLTRPT